MSIAEDIMRSLRPVYPGAIASSIVRLLNLQGARADQHQANGAYGVHQVRVRLPGDPTIYRVIVAPADAPLQVGQLPIDQHFIEPINGSADHG